MPAAVQMCMCSVLDYEFQLTFGTTAGSQKLMRRVDQMRVLSSSM